jgi:hypothetical protein
MFLDNCARELTRFFTLVGVSGEIDFAKRVYTYR